MVETPDFLMESVAPASSFDKTFTMMNARPSQQSLPAEFVGMFDLKETLGSGHFSVVKKAQHVLSRRAVAVKIIDKKALKPDELKHLDHEVKAMRLVRHPHVIRLYEVKDTKTKLFLILELGDGGDLYEYLTKNGKLSEEHAQTIFRQIVEAVAYCHKHHIAHRDLKPENVGPCPSLHAMHLLISSSDTYVCCRLCLSMRKAMTEPRVWLLKSQTLDFQMILLLARK